MDFVSLVADIIPIKGGQCSFYFNLPINQGFRTKTGSKFDTTFFTEEEQI